MLAVQSRVVLARARGAGVHSRARSRRGFVAHRRRALFPTAAVAASDKVDEVDEVASPGVILLFGFHPDEVAPIADLVGALAQEMEVAGAGELAVARVAGDALGVSAEFLLDGEEMDDAIAEIDFTLPPASRVVLLRGDAAKQLMPDLKLEMVDLGLDPAVFGVFVAKHAGLPLGAVANAVIKAHENYWDLGSVSVENVEESIKKQTTSTQWPGEEAWRPSDTICAMSLVMDHAVVPDPQAWTHVGGTENEKSKTREDRSAVVVLDGIVGESLRAALLAEITEPGWNHLNATAPPTSKWARDTNDGVNGDEEDEEDASSSATTFQEDDEDGDENTHKKKSWGLTAESIETVKNSRCSKTFLSRLASLYPEYAVRLMPCDALEPEGVPGGMSLMFGNGNDDDDDGEEGNSRIATVVGNAAVSGDQFQWHLDMDPGSLDASAPFTERFGRYVNRSFGRPLFVSALVYLNGPALWTPDMNAETLVLDPGTGTGVFIRPGPGRVLLMDQDALHRVSPPSRAAKIPRYSLVFKLCFYPKDPETRPSLVRTEWGAPTMFGTAGGRRAGKGMVGGGEEEC